MNKFEQQWLERYELAKKYYEYHGNLEISQSYRTINGIDYDENGIALGYWLKRQREAYNGKDRRSISEKRINLLKNIGMRFEIKDFDNEWQKKYELAKKYYKYYGDLNIPQKFKTINGYEYDENGVALGIWVKTQREAYKGKGTTKINERQIQMLEKIRMRFENIDLMEGWIKKYNLVKVYYEHYGNLEIAQRFKTINGYEYNEDGVALGIWIRIQREAYKGYGAYKINKNQIKLLNKIKMVWDYDDNVIKQRKINLNTSSYIYVIINLVNNKKYIGQSINPERRFKEHYKRNQTSIDKAMHEYGLSNFKLEILEKTTLEFINEREQYWIDKFNTTDPEYGYNVQKGGTSLARFK